MVMIRYGAGIEEINGKVGGERYRHDWCGNHIEQQVWERKPPTERQKITQNAFSVASFYWDKIGLLENRYYLDLWRAYATEHPVQNKKGETIFLNAYNMFMSVNINRILSGGEATLSPLPELPPDLRIPGITPIQINPFLLRIILIFPQPMKQDWDHTPRIQDFDIYNGLHTYGTIDSIAWENAYTLHIDFWSIIWPTQKLKLFYFRSIRPLSTTEERWYHSFKVYHGF